MQNVWLTIIVVTLPQTLYSIAIDEFYPFGDENGDVQLEFKADVVSSSFEFPSTFNYFTGGHNRGYVSICVLFFNAFEEVNTHFFKFKCLFYSVIFPNLFFY